MSPHSLHDKGTRAIQLAHLQGPRRFELMCYSRLTSNVRQCLRSFGDVLYLQVHCPDWPIANIQAATFAEATGSNTLAPAYPARTLFAAHVAGMNWKSPEAPDDALYAPGLKRLSQYATRSSWSALAP